MTIQTKPDRLIKKRIQDQESVTSQEQKITPKREKPQSITEMESLSQDDFEKCCWVQCQTLLKEDNLSLEQYPEWSINQLL